MLPEWISRGRRESLVLGLLDGGHPRDGGWRGIRIPESRGPCQPQPLHGAHSGGEDLLPEEHWAPGTCKMEGPSQRGPSLFCRMGQGQRPTAMV